MSLTLALSDLEGGESFVGGKAEGLGKLVRHGARVPPGFVLTTAAYEGFVEESGLRAEIDLLLDGLDVDDVTDLQRRANRLQELVLDREIPQGVREELGKSFRALCAEVGRDDVAVAVRSSATGEDSSGNSFAGEYDTYLWVEGIAAIEEAVKRCWASLFGAQAVSYRAERGIPQASSAMAVTIQQLVPSKAAGVMFTLHPTSGDYSTIAIEGSWGLGKIVVDGEANPDMYLVDKASMTVTERRISEKEVQCVRAPAGLTVTEPVPAELRSEPCLQDVEILELARIGKDLHRAFGGPQDIEWAIDGSLPAGDGIFIVQCRPETVWSSKVPAKTTEGSGMMDWVMQSIGLPDTSK